MKDERDTITLNKITDFRWLTEIIRQAPPDTVAYAVIKMFLETNGASDELRLSFMKWLTNGHNCKAKDRALERYFCEIVEKGGSNGSMSLEGWEELSERLNLSDKESS